VITPSRLETFANVIREKIESGDIHARKGYLRSIISYIGRP
jgi:hypothetical protein